VDGAAANGGAANGGAANGAPVDRTLSDSSVLDSTVLAGKVSASTVLASTLLTDTGPPGPDQPDTVVLAPSAATADPAPAPRSVAARYAAESAAAAAVLRAAGWHVTSVDASTPLAVAWQRLPRAAEMLVATGTTIYPGTESGQRA